MKRSVHFVNRRQKTPSVSRIILLIIIKMKNPQYHHQVEGNVHLLYHPGIPSSQVQVKRTIFYRLQSRQLITC
ncbi:unnamed protein product [Trichobilharzia regenti]|nr:unnamed protein product [Trichobilharzia regenti]